MVHEYEDDETVELPPLELDCLRDTVRSTIDLDLADGAEDRRPSETLLGSALPPRVFITDPGGASRTPSSPWLPLRIAWVTPSAPSGRR